MIIFLFLLYKYLKKNSLFLFFFFFCINLFYNVCWITNSASNKETFSILISSLVFHLPISNGKGFQSLCCHEIWMHQNSVRTQDWLFKLLCLMLTKSPLWFCAKRRNVFIRWIPIIPSVMILIIECISQNKKCSLSPDLIPIKTFLSELFLFYWL